MSATEKESPARPAVSFASVRRKIIVLGILLFLVGFVAGALFGVFGFRMIMFKYRPAPEKIAAKRATAIQRDLGLSDATREKIVEENRKHFYLIRNNFEAMRSKLEASIDEYAENVAKLIDDPEKRKRWLASYRNYFPPDPPPPGPPPPP